nr:MAG TPA: replisome organizer [Caudoviricetes sp.]
MLKSHGSVKKTRKKVMLMAEKRMFTQKIIDSDAFLDMPLSTQALYFHLNMRADDDGFINNPKRIQRTIGASDDDLKLLIAKRFVICFENGVIVIKHWRMHNTLRKDRYNPTQYQEQLAMLDVKDNNAYTEKPVDQMATTWQPNGNHLEPQHSIDKYSRDKESIVEDSISESDDSASSPKPSKPVKHKYGEYKNVLLTDDELEKLKDEYLDWEERIERLSSYVASTGKSYKSHYATIRNWARKDQERFTQSVKQPYHKQTKAEELDDFYAMAKEWSET